MLAVHAPQHRLHDPELEVTGGRPIPAYEVAARGEAILAALRADGGFSFQEPREFGPAPILAVHDEGLLRYLEGAWDDWRRAGTGASAIVPDTLAHARLREGMGAAPEPDSPCGRVGYWCFDTATPIGAGTYAAARASVDVALTASEAVLGGERLAYGLCRPPGHHAARALFGGYCYFNNAAAAAAWLAERGEGPVGILDVDFHHGNGTQQIFYGRADVAYASLHADPRGTYPYFTGHAGETGAGPGAGWTLNLPLARGTAEAPYAAALERALGWLDERTRGPLVVSLGLDTHERDPIGSFRLTTEAYGRLGGRVSALGRRQVILQEGGYFLPALGESARSWLRAAEEAAP
ncbi:MAG: histone deacetylase family protein [Candidatus Limnocylindrales bacterium]